MKYLTTKNKLPTAVLDWAINVTRNITFSHSGFLFTFNSTSDTRLKLTIYDMHPFKVLKVFSVPPLGRAHCLVFLGKTHYFHSAFLNQSVRKFNAGLTLPWTSIPPKGSRHTPSCFLQQEPRQAPAWLVACSYTDFTNIWWKLFVFTWLYLEQLLSIKRISLTKSTADVYWREWSFSLIMDKSMGFLITL